MTDTAPQPGAIALVGSGEYLEPMLETDRLLLDRVGGPTKARVVVLPTASGLEEAASPARWMRLGVEHFTRLGAHVDAVPVLDHQSAHHPQFVALLEQADFIYFSGGNPQHLISSMADTPAWDTVQRRYLQGASLAGCSAGAMALAGRTLARLGALREGVTPEWSKALALLPQLIVLPHFDRMASFIGSDTFERVLAAIPRDNTMLGIDEDTALVRLDSSPDGDGRTSWQVIGRRSVSVFNHETITVYHVGESVPLITG